MAVLGVGGKLLLKRSAPEPCLVNADSVISEINSIQSICTGYWSGDRVSTNCLPLAGGVFPPNPKGYASYYGSRWFLGPNRDHITANTDNFYKADNKASAGDYQNALWECGSGSGEYGFSDAQDTITSISICEDAPDYEIPEAGTAEYDNANLLPRGDRGNEDYPDGQFGDDAQFYAREGDVSGGHEIKPCDNGDYWIHIDALGRVSFYRSRCDALAGCPSNRVDIEAQAAGTITIAPYGSLEYWNAIWECVSRYGEYKFSDAQDTVTLASICEDPPKYEIPEAGIDEYDNANLLPRGQEGSAAPYWQILCDIREWTLELEAAAVDTTAVSEKFGTAVKSLVTAGGSTEFLIDRKCFDDDQDNGLALMQLLLMTEKGCQASAQFWVMSGTNPCEVDCDGRINGGLYYETDILITNTAVNLRPTEIVAGTASFVSTGEIRLLTGP